MREKKREGENKKQMAKKCQREGKMEKEMVIKQNRGTMETNQSQQQSKEKSLKGELTCEGIFNTI